MDALVTGATGFTGSHLVKALIQQGHRVKGLVRASSDRFRLAGWDLEWVVADLGNPQGLEQALNQAMTGVDSVFHTAAYVDLGIVDEARMAQVNVEGTRAIIRAMQTAPDPTPNKKPSLIYCSTIGILGDTQGRVVDETWQRTQTGFSSAYDRTKYQAQCLVDQAAAQGLRAISVLPSGIMGPADPHFGPVINLFCKGRLKWWPGGDRITGIVHVEDLVAAMILAWERGQTGHHYIISAGELRTRDMFIQLSEMTGIAAPMEAPEGVVRLLGNLLNPIGKLSGWNPPLSRERVHYLYDRCVRVQATKARQELGWHPRSIPEILQTCLLDPMETS
jgi:nucleoside-diphosphate-sugar epimerase